MLFMKIMGDICITGYFLLFGCSSRLAIPILQGGTLPRWATLPLLLDGRGPRRPPSPPWQICTTLNLYREMINWSPASQQGAQPPHQPCCPRWPGSSRARLVADQTCARISRRRWWCRSNLLAATVNMSGWGFPRDTSGSSLPYTFMRSWHFSFF